MSDENLPPIHPGEFLADELRALGLSARRFAEHIGVPHNAVSEIVAGRRSISASMALRLGQAFATGGQYWMSLQDLYDAKIAREALGDRLAAIVPLVPVGDGSQASAG
ncbi:HigA family addiction module antitoxin [Nitrospirillum sp. BR 11828]|uniref:HigA family addiction module antitoxin n=1 Tax=Nitrospirillum sp. BR 11828 TaxID=3104325 RepID=UPI002ACA34E4|nr:HigA family addiction module antitoxin [Nitrospirillum sp. BR 11828]MDZ5646374.1 HigA family addiction module antitoxin [Nitrospirillum sp. BR 11828]